jgi:phosphate-selective porin OprO/OprP
VSLANGRPTITSADGNFKFALRSVAQLDAAHSNVDPQTATNDIASGTNIRRARLGFDATAFKVWNIALWGEFGGSNNESPALNQAFVEYAGFKPLSSADPLRIRVGAWAAPVGLEDATSNTEMIFLERPAVEETVRGLVAGDGREGAGLFWSGPHWYVSGILTGKVVGTPSTPVYDQQEGYITRLAVNPFHGSDYDVHIGGAIVGIIKPADTTAGPLTTKSITLAQQPELKVDSNNTKLISTGAITADGMTSYSVEGGASIHNFYLAGEWYWIDVNRTAIGVVPAPSPFDPSFTGWYVLGAWTLTGEHRVWSQANGGFRGVQPAHPFDPSSGGWGAFEIAARYSVFDLNDQAGTLGLPAPVGGIRGGVQKITTIGLNWYPNNVVRFLFDYQTGQVHRLSPTGTPAGEHIDAVSFRSQFAF